MIERAKKLGVYQNFDAMYLGTGDIPEKFQGKYDVAIQAAGFLPGHLPSHTINQMLQTLKPNGYMMLSVREKVFVELGHQTLIDELLKAGKIKLLKQFCWVKYEGMQVKEVKDSDFFHPDPASVSVFQRLY